MDDIRSICGLFFGFIFTGSKYLWILCIAGYPQNICLLQKDEKIEEAHVHGQIITTIINPKLSQR